MSDKTDRVITMEEFEAEANGDRADDPFNMSSADLLDYMKKLDLEYVVAVGVGKDGNMGYFSNNGDPAHIVFLCESFKKAILENTLTRAEAPDLD